MYKWLKSFIDKYDIPHKFQYDFRKHRSTQHALIDIVSKLNSTKDYIDAEYLKI